MSFITDDDCVSAPLIATNISDFNSAIFWYHVYSQVHKNRFIIMSRVVVNIAVYLGVLRLTLNNE